MASKLDRLQKKGFKVNEAALSKIARGDQHLHPLAGAFVRQSKSIVPEHPQHASIVVVRRFRHLANSFNLAFGEHSLSPMFCQS